MPISVGSRLAIALIACHAALLAWSAGQQAPTLNEPAHLAAGIDYLQTSRVSLYQQNPPLVRAVAAAATLAVYPDLAPKVPFSLQSNRNHFVAGNLMVRQQRERFIPVLFLARCACIPLSICGALVCFFWARELYGGWAALVSLSLWCFDPTVLGHAALITPDVGASALGLAACYAFWLWLTRDGWKRAFVAGICLGLAGLTKFTWLPLFALWPLLWLVWDFSSGRRRGSPLLRVLQLFGLIIVALYAINVAYGARQTFNRIECFDFVSARLSGTEMGPGNRFRDCGYGWVRLPLPTDFVMGVDAQMRDVDESGELCYLMGVWRENGWWYYYLIAAGLKLPIGTLIALAYGIARLRDSRSLRCGELVLVASAVMLLTLLSVHTSFNHHFRYALPVLGLLFVLAGKGFAPVAVGSGLTPWPMRLSIACASLVAVSSLGAYPHSITYVNELAGGPRMAWRYLAHSNVDWGQGLFAAHKWLREHEPSKALFLSYQGFYEPADLGVMYSPPELKMTADPGKYYLPAGMHLVSVNVLHGQEFSPADGRGGYSPYNSAYYAKLREVEPLMTFAYCMALFRVDESDRD